MILRVPFVYKYSGYILLPVCHATTNKAEPGKATLSLKYKKRRRLVSGEIRLGWHNCINGEVHQDFIFFPNDPEKLDRVMGWGR